MEPGVSVSKGCFVFKNASMRRGKKRPVSIPSSSWYHTYQETWKRIHNKIEGILRENYSRVMESVLECVLATNSSVYSYLFPVIVLQTGINQPDHLSMFERLSEEISGQDGVFSVVLTSTEATTVKTAIEVLVGGFISQFREVEVRKQNCSMRSLCGAFLEHKDEVKTLAIVIPDFELFCKATLRELVTILGSYRHQLPLCVVFGVATSISSLEQLLPIKFTTRAKFHVFQTQSSVVILNNIVEEVLLRERIHLSGRVLQFLVEKFLFYDFSISGFVQGVKFCLLDHFSRGDIYTLAAGTAPEALNPDDCENIRRLMSVRRHVETLQDSQEIISLLTDDKHLKNTIQTHWIPSIQEFFLHFHSALRFLHELVRELPKCPLGKQLREIYCFSTANPLLSSPEYSECRQLLTVMSRKAFFQKLSSCFARINTFNPKIHEKLLKILQRCEDILQEDTESQKKEIPAVANRFELKKMLLEKAREQTMSSGQGILSQCLKIVEDEILEPWLVPLARGPPLIELFVHSDASATRRHLMGSPRGALHQALTNPQHYLQCGCCDGNSLNCHLPDLSIAYRLHTECGRMINLFDWLQAFQAIVRDMDDEGSISSQVQARFTRAVGELEFLGYIRSSKRKVDHVEKLTW